MNHFMLPPSPFRALRSPSEASGRRGRGMGRKTYPESGVGKSWRQGQTQTYRVCPAPPALLAFMSMRVVPQNGPYPRFGTVRKPTSGRPGPHSF